MFDLSSIMDRIGGVLENSDAVHETAVRHIEDTLAGGEVDQALAEHLTADRIDELAAVSGIDIAALSDGQVAEIVARFGNGNGLEGLDLGAIVEGGLQK